MPHLQHEGLLHSPVVARTAGEQDAGVSLDRTRLPSDSQSQISKLCTPPLCWQLYPSIVTRTGEIIRHSQCLTNDHSPLPSKQYNTVSDFINGIYRLHGRLVQGVTRSYSNILLNDQFMKNDDFKSLIESEFGYQQLVKIFGKSANYKLLSGKNILKTFTMI